jgi:mannose-6-phosphate isomerase class I
MRGMILLSANAYARADIGMQLSVCAAKTDKTVRLTCYDVLAANAKPSAHMTTATAVKIAPTEAPTPTTPITPQVLSVDDFGLQKKAIEDDVAKIYAEVASVNKDAVGALFITLINGQVWKQNSPKRYKIKQGQRIFIETGALNSFLLGSDERNATIRVRRLK